MDEILKRLADRWYVKVEFLRDIYFLMRNDLRFSSMRTISGVRYTKVSRYLKDNYMVSINPRQLKYLVCLIKNKKNTNH